jgi:mannose-6-phosphate isomerase-like protein (cupin superfamily)
MSFRVLEIPPDMKDRKKHIELMKELNRKLKQKCPPTDKDLERHPTMHRTDTLDCFVVLRAEAYLVSDTGEVLLRAGDTAVVQGVNHAWSNRSNEPVLIVGIMTLAKPLPKERYLAAGL